MDRHGKISVSRNQGTTHLFTHPPCCFYKSGWKIVYPISFSMEYRLLQMGSEVFNFSFNIIDSIYGSGSQAILRSAFSVKMSTLLASSMHERMCFIHHPFFLNLIRIPGVLFLASLYSSCRLLIHTVELTSSTLVRRLLSSRHIQRPSCSRHQNHLTPHLTGPLRSVMYLRPHTARSYTLLPVRQGYHAGVGSFVWAPSWWALSARVRTRRNQPHRTAPADRFPGGSRETRGPSQSVSQDV